MCNVHVCLSVFVTKEERIQIEIGILLKKSFRKSKKEASRSVASAFHVFHYDANNAVGLLNGFLDSINETLQLAS